MLEVVTHYPTELWYTLLNTFTHAKQDNSILCVIFHRYRGTYPKEGDILGGLILLWGVIILTNCCIGDGGSKIETKIIHADSLIEISNFL